LLFSPNDHHELADVLERLVNLSPVKRAKIRARLRSKIEKEHNSKVQIARIISYMKPFIR